MAADSVRPAVPGFHQEPSSSVAYIVEDAATRRAAIIDPVLDYEEMSGRVSATFADRLLGEIKTRGLQVDWILDTHPHTDLFSPADYLKGKLRAPIAIGQKIVEVQALWKKIYNMPNFPADGSQWDR